MKLSLFPLGTIAFAAMGAVAACAASEMQAAEPPQQQLFPEAGGDGNVAVDAASTDGAEAGPVVVGERKVEVTPIPGDARIANVLAMWGASAADIWAVGLGGLSLHYDGTAWKTVPTGADQALTGLWGRSTGDVFAGSNSQLMIRTKGLDGGLTDGGSPWKRMPGVEPLFTFAYYALWGTKTDLWAGGIIQNPDTNDYGLMRGRLLGDGGVGWSHVAADGAFQNVNAIWGSSDSDLWAVGLDGAAVHGVANTLGELAWSTTQSLSNESFRAVHGSAANDVWAVGEVGTVRHWTDNALGRWSHVEFPSVADLRAVHAFGPTDVWVAGRAGVVMHFDGTTWTQLAVPGAPDLNAMWASGPDDIWIGGKLALVHIVPMGTK